MYKLIEINTGNGAAWRAIYVNILGGQVFRLVLDPTAQRGPQLSCQFGLGNFCNRVKPAWLGRLCWKLHTSTIRVPMPCVRWKYNGSKARNWLAAKSTAFWISLDGRKAYYRAQGAK